MPKARQVGRKTRDENVYIKCVYYYGFQEGPCPTEQENLYVPRLLGRSVFCFKALQCIQETNKVASEIETVNTTRGYGVFATESFKKGYLLLQYVGKCIPVREGKRLGQEYFKEGRGCICTFFKHNSHKYWYVLTYTPVALLQGRSRATCE